MHADPIEALAALLQERVGLNSTPAVRARLHRCIEEGADQERMTLPDYVKKVMSDDRSFQSLLDRVTVQHSYFFRDLSQLDAFAELVRAHGPEPLTVWSAGCGNGQEPYTLAMLLDESGHPDWNVIATDVSSQAVERTRAASYTEAEVRDLSPSRRARYLVRTGRDLQVQPFLRTQVHVRHHNFASVAPPARTGACAFVFCRNALIYFERSQVASFIDRLADWMPPGGYLFLGFSESLWQVSDRFKLIKMGSAYVYRKPPRASGAAALPPPDRRSDARGQDRRTTPSPLPSPAELLAAGERAAAAGRPQEAIRSFRQAAFLDPSRPISHFLLGVAFEQVGDQRGARRAFAAAGAALSRNPAEGWDAALEGYHADELARAIANRLADS